MLFRSAHAPDRTLTADQMIRELQRRAPGAAQDSIDALLGLVELDEDVRDDIAILSVRVTRAAEGLHSVAGAPAPLSRPLAEFATDSERQRGRRAS